MSVRILPTLGRQCTYVFKFKRWTNLGSLFIENIYESSHLSSNIFLKRNMYFNTTQAITKERQGSRYHPGSAIEQAEEKVKEILSKTSLKTTEEWEELKDKLMTDMEVFTEINFSSIMMNCLYILNKHEEAHSFMRFLKDVKIEPNYLTYLKYMALCGRNVEHCGQEIILQTFEKVKPFIDAVPVLDQTTATHVIQGLSSTDKWQLSLQYYTKILQKPLMEMKNCIAAAAIRNADEYLAWEILNKWLKPEEQPNNKVLQAFMLHILRLQTKESKRSEEFLTKFLKYLQVKNIIVKEEVAHLIEKYFKCHTTEWSISHSKVSRVGECSSCKRSLELMELSSEEFRYLRDSFLERSLMKTDLFINTTQREFNQFNRYIDSHAPFHIVLDALNIAHTVSGIKTRNSLALQLLDVVQRFNRGSRKLLVLGKHHMTYWPKPVMEKISRKAHVFLTSNISQDDPFMVYAALASGPHSYIVSSDLMRDHIARLDDPKLISLFKKWQETHQIYLMPDENKKVKFIEPLHYSINIQGSMQDGFHIPYDDKIILDPYEELNNWLCIQKVY